MNDFDFLAGEWRVENRRLAKALEGCDEWETFPGSSTCQRIFGGAANVDWIHFPTLGRSGLSVRLYRPESDDWSIYWVSSRDGLVQPPVVGTFADGMGTFLGDDVYDDRPIRVRYLWSEITETSARWEQAFSIDDDRTWETNWIMNFERQRAQPAW
jgi:hypothetical protein